MNNQNNFTMQEITKIGNIMTTDVMTVKKDTSMQEVADIFENNNFHHLPVVNNKGRVVGILSKVEYYKIQHGFTCFKHRIAEEFNEEVLSSVTAEEMMTQHVAKLHPDDSLESAMGFFRENLFHAAPVVNPENGKLEGIITTFDLLNVCFQKATIF